MLTQQIRLMEAHMAAATERSELSVESVVRELRARNKAFQDAKQQLENTRATIALLDRAIQLRLEKWHYFRRFVAVRARANFALHLQNRGFSGSLHFDHNAQTLKLRVRWFSDGQVHTGDSTQPMDKDPKALSGGEKSFATICLLLSLWEAIGCPIRCLDEFDVFMDAVNRQVSMKMIVCGAANPGRCSARIGWRAVHFDYAAKHGERIAGPVSLCLLTTAMCKSIECRTPSAVSAPNYMLGTCHDPVVRCALSLTRCVSKSLAGVGIPYARPNSPR